MNGNFGGMGPVQVTQLPWSIGQSCSRTPRESAGADSGADRPGSNGVICTGPDSRHKLTGGAGGEHLFPSQITFTVHRQRDRHIFGTKPESLNPGLFLYSALTSAEDLSPWF